MAEEGQPQVSEQPEQPERTADEKRAAQDSARPANVITVFNGRVTAGGLSVGVSGRDQLPSRRAGRVDPDDIRQVLDGYTPPDTYDDALNALLADRVVVLEGEGGVGKQAGALSLLREVVSGSMAVLSPVISLDELAERSYDPDYGYVVLDREDEGRSQETDFMWRTVRDQVRDAGAYLVVTSSKVYGSTPAVRHVRWRRPPLRTALRAHLSGRPVAEEVIEAVCAALTDTCSMADFAVIAARVARGEDYDKVLAGYDSALGSVVRDWCARDRPRRELLEVTALAFAEYTNDREFESRLDRLEAIMALYIPVPEPAEDPARPEPDTIPARRYARTGDDGLIGFELVAEGPATDRVLVFRKEAYRGHVLAALWARYETPFWNAVAHWIAEYLTEQADERGAVEVAKGLALLARANFGEVQKSFLEPCSRGACGWAGQATAALTLWGMCFADATAPVALRSAKRWANHGDGAQRWTAAMAFGGTLGVCYPIEAVRTLWQLILQSADEQTQPQLALAALFTMLDDVKDARRLLRYLDRNITEAIDPRHQSLARRALLAVLEGDRPQTGHRAVFDFLHRAPEQAGLVARLWVSLFRHSLYRRAALGELLTGLASLARLSADPGGDARRLGAALRLIMPADEHHRFKVDLTAVETSRSHRVDLTRSLTQILLAAFD